MDAVMQGRELAIDNLYKGKAKKLKRVNSVQHDEVRASSKARVTTVYTGQVSRSE